MEIFVTRLQDYLREVAEFSRLCYNKVRLSDALEDLRILEPTETTRSPECQKKPKISDVCSESLDSVPLPVLPQETSSKSFSTVSEFVVPPGVSSELQQMRLPSEESVQKKPRERSRKVTGYKRRKRGRSTTTQTPPKKPTLTEEQIEDKKTIIQNLKNDIEELSQGLERLPSLALALWNRGKSLYCQHDGVLVTIQNRFHELKCGFEDSEPLFDMVWAHILPSILRDLKNYNQETCYKQFNFKKDTWQYLSELNYQEFKSRVSALQPQILQIFLCETIFNAIRSLSQTLRDNVDDCFKIRQVEPVPEQIKCKIRWVLKSEFALQVYKEVSPDLISKELSDLVETHLKTARIISFSHANFHGLTLVTKEMLLDHLKPPKCPEKLELGAIFVFFLHEMGHVVVRRNAMTLFECYETCTRMKSSTKYPKIENPVIPSDEDNLRFSDNIDAFLPHQEHGEAGDQVELLLFGEKLDHLTLKGYNFMTIQDNWTTDFKKRFCKKNARPRNETPENCLSLARTRGKASVNCIDLKKGCKYSFYGAYL